MGQTLTNNIYLPDEGERNCYAGLAANWRALDAHLGNTDIHVTYADKQAWNDHVADTVKHVTAEDKARWDAVTSKADDSDVVHKSGNETVGGAKTFTDNNMIKTSSPKVLLINTSQTGNTPPSSNAASFFRFDGGTVNNFGGVQCEFLTTGENRLTNYVKDITTAKFNSIQQRASSTTAMTVFNADLIAPATNGITALGSSSKRWSNIYGMNYYYGSNNVEFSTKFVTTDTAQTISKSKTFTNTIKIKKEIELSGNRLAYILPNFSAGYSGLSLCTYDASGAVTIGTWKVDDNDNTKHVLDSSLGYLNVSTGSSNSVNIVYLTPRNASKAKLGDSVNKWHEINGLEPSSLSLPSGNLTDSIDISSYFANTGTGETNSYTASANGWIYLRLGDISSCQATVYDSNNNRMWGQSSTGSVEQMTIPILKGQTLSIQWNTSSTVNVANARFIPCQGNV